MGLILLLLTAVVLLWLFGAAALVYSLTHPRRKTFAVALGRGDPTDPADLGLEAQEVTFSLSDRSRTPGWVIQGGGESCGDDEAGGDPRQLRSPRHGVVTTTGGSSPGRLTVVIVHGFGDSRYGALKRVPLVVPYARRVVVFDLPGQGESESRRGYGGLREPKDVLAVLEQLEVADARRIVLLGSSMGAGVAIAAAAQAGGELRGRIVGVIAEAPYRHWDEPLHNRFKHHHYPRWPIIPLAGLWLTLTAKGFTRFDRAGYAAQLACPLRVIHGSDDPLCPITSAKEIAEAAPAGELIEIPGGRHDDLPTAHEPAYKDAIAGFLKMLCEPDRSGKIASLAAPAPGAPE